MPRKVRELIKDLEAAGFVDRGGRGDHRNFTHPKVAKPVTISGKLGDDAKRYQGKGRLHSYRGVKAMSTAARYAKIVEWSDEDQCFVGSCPGLLYGGCHGDDEQQVFAELCKIVEETIHQYRTDGKALPPPTSGRDYANKMLGIV